MGDEGGEGNRNNNCLMNLNYSYDPVTINYRLSEKQNFLIDTGLLNEY